MNRKDGKPKIKKNTICNKCNDLISNFAFNRHYNKCIGINKNLRKKETSGLHLMNVKKINENFYFCLECNKEYKKSGIGSHYWRVHNENGKKFIPNKKGSKNIISWNKGLTKETDDRIRIMSEKISISNKTKKRIHSLETKKRISNSMKKAHKENRAWNIGKSRWNNKKSYPEEFFTKVIFNEFLDKDYIYEYPFYKYSLDFAWVSKKKVIEIDGEQHERFEEHKQRDIKKDQLLIENGWKVLRIKWKDMYNNAKLKIKEAYDFIHNN
jgi:very-short-patch-repair endonuclease